MPPDFDQLQRQASSLTQRRLIKLARELGWEIDRGRAKGSHVAAIKGSLTLTIPRHPKPATVHSILRTLEQEARRG